MRKQCILLSVIGLSCKRQAQKAKATLYVCRSITERVSVCNEGGGMRKERWKVNKVKFHDLYVRRLSLPNNITGM